MEQQAHKIGLNLFQEGTFQGAIAKPRQTAKQSECCSTYSWSGLVGGTE